MAKGHRQEAPVDWTVSLNRADCYTESFTTRLEEWGLDVTTNDSSVRISGPYDQLAKVKGYLQHHIGSQDSSESDSSDEEPPVHDPTYVNMEPFLKPDAESLWVFSMGAQTIKAYRCDITDAQVDAIVNPMGRTFRDQGQVAKAIFESSGDQYKRTLQWYIETGKKLERGECFVMDSCKDRGFKHVIHVRGPDGSLSLHNLSRDAKNKDLRDAVQSILKEVQLRRSNIKSVAFPAIGAGNAGMKPGQAIRELLKTIIDHGDRMESDLEVHCVSPNEKEVAIFVSEMEKLQKS